MKYLRELNDKEIIDADDYALGNRVLISKLSCAGRTVEESEYRSVYRPVEMRGPDELTYEEKQHLRDIISDESSIGLLSIDAMLKEADKLRSRPRETEKEKWIREYCKEHGLSLYSSIKNRLSEAWDAGYEAGRKNE
jgi:hypothetical protein